MAGGKIGGLHLAGAFAASMIGAGFASGQEHLQFFVKFGHQGWWGIGTAGLLLAVCGGLFLLIAHEHRTVSHRELLKAVCADGTVTTLFDIVLSATMLTSISVMMAGGGALVAHAFGVSPLVGATLLGAAAAIVVGLGLEHMLNVNSILTIALASLISWVTLKVGLGSAEPILSVTGIPSAPRASWVPESWLYASLLYVSYNLTFAFSFFGALGKEIRTRTDAWSGGVAGGVLLTLLGAGVCVSVSATVGLGQVGEMPMLLAAGAAGPIVAALYTFLIWAAMLTTAIAALFALTRRVASRVRVGSPYIAPLIVGVAAPLSGAGFGKLVGTAYPLTGYVGAGCIVLTLVHWVTGLSRRGVTRRPR